MWYYTDSFINLIFQSNLVHGTYLYERILYNLGLDNRPQVNPLFIAILSAHFKRKGRKYTCIFPSAIASIYFCRSVKFTKCRFESPLNYFYFFSSQSLSSIKHFFKTVNPQLTKQQNKRRFKENQTVFYEKLYIVLLIILIFFNLSFC